MAHDLGTIPDGPKWHGVERDPATQGALAAIAENQKLIVAAGETFNPDEVWLLDATTEDKDVLVEFKPAMFDEHGEWHLDKLKRIKEYITDLYVQVEDDQGERRARAEFEEWYQNHHGELEGFVIEELGALRPDWKYPAWREHLDPRKEARESAITWEYPGFISIPLGKKRHFAIGCGTNGLGVWSGNLDGWDGCKVEGGGSEENIYIDDLPVSQWRNARYIAERIVKELEAWGY